MSTHRHVFFTLRTLIFLCLAVFISLTSGCKDDEAAVKAAEEKAKEIKKKKAEEEKVRALPVPMAPVDLFRQLPKVPPGLAVLPGASLDDLKKKRPKLKDSDYSSLWKSEHPKEGPFRMVHYQLGKQGKNVEAVLGSFVNGYTLKERKDALVEAIQIRLGAGEPFSEENYEGRRWKLIDFRMDLRTDKTSKGLELLIHRRGRFDPVAQPTGE